MICDDGWRRYCIWEHSAMVKEVYARRCRLEEEPTYAAQAAELEGYEKELAGLIENDLAALGETADRLGVPGIYVPAR